MTRERKLELVRELGELQRAYTLCDKSAENKARGERILEIKAELGIKPCEPRKNRRPPRVVNR